MKGQYYLISVFFLILFFYIGLRAYISPSITLISSDELTNFFDNVKSEYTRSFNLGMKDEKAISSLSNFTLFVKNVANKRNMKLKTFWMVTENVSNMLNITVGNYFEEPIGVTINVSGESVSIDLDNEEIKSVIFSDVPSEFSLRLGFNNKESNLLLEKYKANLYVFLDLERGEEKLKGEIKA
jgi:hypothetical protein